MNACITTAALLLATVPQETGVVRDRVCCIEIQHYCDDEAREVFCQAIFWEMHNGRERVVDWRLVKNLTDRGANIKPQRDYRTELTDRQHHPQDRRRKLGSGREVYIPSLPAPERRWTE